MLTCNDTYSLLAFAHLTMRLLRASCPPIVQAGILWQEATLFSSDAFPHSCARGKCSPAGVSPHRRFPLQPLSPISRIADGNVRRLQKPVGENKVREKEAVRELVILSMCCSAGRAFCRGPYLVRANPRYGRDDWSVAYKK